MHRRPPRWIRTAIGLALALGGCQGSSGPTGPGTPRPLVYVGLGASDAVGIGAIPLTRGYVYDIGERMGATGFTVTLHNLGVSGAKADELAASSLDRAIAANPDVVTLWTGINDLVSGRSPDAFAAQLDGILAELSARTSALVVVGDLPDMTRAPLFLVNPDPDVTAARIAAFNDRIRAVVAARGAVLAPLASLPTDPGMWFLDGFHPSNTGHRRIADLFWAEIAPRL